MAALLAEFLPEGPALDVGCGSGDLSIHLAQSGIETLGMDFVEEAIAQAKAKKAALSPDVASRLEFVLGDALRPSLLGRTFGAVVDSGFYHLLDPEESERFVRELARVLRPGGRCFLHEFAVTFPVPNVPRDVTEAELRRFFSEEHGWRVLTIRRAEFLSRVGAVPATLACIERASDQRNDAVADRA